MILIKQQQAYESFQYEGWRRGFLHHKEPIRCPSVISACQESVHGVRIYGALMEGRIYNNVGWKCCSFFTLFLSCLPSIPFPAFVILTCLYLSSSHFLRLFSHFPAIHWTFFFWLSPPSSTPLASDIASDQGQVLVIVTAAVGGFTLLVILTLFLLITGR